MRPRKRRNASAAAAAVTAVVAAKRSPVQDANKLTCVSHAMMRQIRVQKDEAANRGVHLFYLLQTAGMRDQFADRPLLVGKER